MVDWCVLGHGNQPVALQNSIAKALGDGIRITASVLKSPAAGGVIGLAIGVREDLGEGGGIRCVSIL